MRGKRALALLFPLALAGFSASRIPWEELTEGDWIYSLATRFATVDGHRVHYPTPTAELAKLLEARGESAALRHLAEARLALGDRKGALSAMEKWAEAEGAEAWAETARWAASHQEMASAFKAAERALPGLKDEAKKALADERIAWADQHPDQADGIALRKARAELFPLDSQALEAWLRALEKANRLPEADQGLAATKALTPERRLLLRSDLLADHGDHQNAFKILDAAIAEAWSIDVRRAYTKRVDEASTTLPESWRTLLESHYDAGALVRLATYFQGQGRGDAVADLLRQAERRYEATLTRTDYLLLARIYGEIDAAPEAFRATLAAAHGGSPDEQKSDLAALSRLAIRAGGRPLAWGNYNDETYHWVARVDRTPGFWTGGVSFLLTGLDWKDAMDHLESESLPDRTFTTARALADELAHRAPQHPDLPALRVAIMERHVERGEGKAALALLPLVETAAPATADEARRVALLAARQTQVPAAEELRLMKARLRYLAPDGSAPNLDSSQGGNRAFGENAGDETPNESEGQMEGETGAGASQSKPWARLPQAAAQPRYGDILEESLARLEHLDPSHRTSLDLILSELDRLPDAENLWLALASRLEGWNLDDELGPRYERALTRFQGAGIWARTARWYAKRNRHSDLKKLAEDIANRFRSSAIFERAAQAGDVRVEIPEQPALGGRVRLVLWADWVRLKALERFPHSPTVFREAQSLVTASRWQTHYDPVQEAKKNQAPVIVPDSLMEERRWAVLFVEPAQREAYFGEAMRKGTLEANLAALEKRSDRTPVEDLLLFEGWARLSRFEQAAAPADRLAASYPGDGTLAQRVLSLHRSLNGLDSTQAASAYDVVKRTAPSLEDPSQLWTELGELEEERGRPQAAETVWQNIVEGEPRNPKAISDLATLLWDYGHDSEALKVVEDGRKNMNRPRFFAFETGVLRENVKDIEGAVGEYLNAVRPENPDGFGSWFERDQRSLRRLAQLMARERVFNIVVKRINALKPGAPEDERALAAFFPLATIEAPDPGLSWDADSWIDSMDMPNDPKGREQRETQKGKDRPKEFDAIRRIGDVMLAKTRDMVAQASAPEFLNAVENWSGDLIQARWKQDQAISFKNAVLARRAQLAPSEEERIRMEVARARYLAENAQVQAADSVWATLDTRIGLLPEGVPKLRVEAERAGYLERAKGVEAAAAEWQRITSRYPWSLGLLEDRLNFLNRAGMGKEARAVLEDVIPNAATGHREALLERLAKECLAAPDLPRARRAVAKLLAEGDLEEMRRLGAIHLLARLSLKEDPAWDPFPLAKAEGAKIKPELQADLYHELARAADLESAPGIAMRLWIEALNRRTEREWLQGAARSATRAGKGPELLGFYEKQQARSPRDVRWAVAVRDIKRDFHQVDGAIAAAKTAVAIRPEKEILWREAAELMIRADQIREAADYLEGWNRPRPADEGVAHWRGELYSRAGDGEKALALERAALGAFAQEAPDNEDELAEREARAAVRLLDYGLPGLALKLYSPSNDVRELGKSKVPSDKQCVIALLTGQFVRLLGNRAGDPDFLRTAASILGEQGRPEQKEEVQAFLVRQLFPIRATQPSGRALQTWWPFVTQSGLERATRVAMAERLTAARPGPWQVTPPLTFVDRVGGELIGSRATSDGSSEWYFNDPDLNPVWARDLARRDKPEELLAFVEPVWQDLLAQVKGQRELIASSGRLPKASWLDDPAVLQTWARAASGHPEKVRELGEIMSDRRLWDRFWVLAARSWQPTPLVAVLSQDSRTAWFRFWEPEQPTDPVLVARRRVVEKVTVALGRLVQGAPNAVNDPLIVRLRGPQTVGEVLGKNSQWTWPGFALRKNGKGQVMETGEDRVIGQGVDEGRIPGSLWGDRPGEAWYVLEAMARYRQGDKTAPLLPLDVPKRGDETERMLLALRLARGMGDLPLALELEEAYPGPAQDRRWLEGKLTLLMAAGQKEQAFASFQKFIRLGQAKLTEEGFRWLSTLATDLGLPSPLEQLDPSKPVGPVFLAYLQDKRVDAASRFHTADPVDFRTALSNRWRERETELTPQQIRFWLKELWVNNSAGLPRRGLPKLGGLWPHAGDWLDQQAQQDRQSALTALDEAVNPAVQNPRLFILLDKRRVDDTSRILAVRAHLARGEDAQAIAFADEMLAELRRGEDLGFSIPEPEPGPSSSGDETDEGGGAEQSAAPVMHDTPSSDAVVERLKVWLKPFREAKKAPPIEERFRKLLKERRDAGAVSVSAWRLAFQLAPGAEVAGLAQELDQAWFRGELPPDRLGSIAEVLATALPSEAPRWLERWPQAFTYSQARQRAAVFSRLKDLASAAKVLCETRRRGLWRGLEEVQTFDQWRWMGAPVCTQEKLPGYWAVAVTFWKAKADALVPPLGEHLKAHPQDILAVRTALRSLAPAEEDALLRVSLALESNRNQYEGRPEEDQLIFRLRSARDLLPKSWRAAQTALGFTKPEELVQVLVKRRMKTTELNLALADVARIACKSGDDARVNILLGLLTERNASNTKALKAELAAESHGQQESFRLVNGRPAPIRPRDLTWPLFASLLKTEGVR